MMNGTSSFQTMKDTPMLQRTPEWFAVIAALRENGYGGVFSSIPQARNKKLKSNDRRPTAELLAALVELAIAHGRWHYSESGEPLHGCSASSMTKVSASTTGVWQSSGTSATNSRHIPTR